MFYDGSISPPREPPKKMFVIPQWQSKEEMGDGPSSITGGVKDSSLVWTMLTRSNYVEWAMLMQINYEAMEI